MPSPSTGPALLADIGGTHARFALLEGGAITRPATYLCADYPGPEPAAAAYLSAHPGIRPHRGLFAVAAVVDGDLIDIDNSHWRFSLAATRAGLGLARLDAVNDFTAQALAVPWLRRSDLMQVGDGESCPGSPVAVLGPGTGLGVSALVPTDEGRWTALATEGGLATMAAADAREQAVLSWLRRRLGHVSAEDVLSGQGLVNLHRAVVGLAGAEAEELAPDAVSRRALDGSCPHCRAALDLFFAMLGTVAANLALTVGARGGVYLAGGILPRLAEAFGRSGFRRRFADHGRFSGYLAAVPTRLILHRHPAFLGLAGMLGDGDKAGA